MKSLEKTITGITGLDEILHGGLPKGRPTLLCGGPGCGKTALAMEFVCRGARQFGEPGLFVSFEEAQEDIRTNFASCGFGLQEALSEKTVRIESIQISSEYSVEVGEFTLDGLLVRLAYAVNVIGARRLVLDSLDSLFSHFSDTANLRHEISRIFQWIKDEGITAIATSERGDGDSHPARAGGVCIRLRHLYGSSDHGADLKASPPRGQVSRFDPRRG